MLRTLTTDPQRRCFRPCGNSGSRCPGQRSFSGASQHTLGARRAWERMTRTAHAFRSQPSRALAAGRRLGRIGCAVVVIACGDSGSVAPAPPPEQLLPPPALESIPYERLGSGKLAFRRASDGNYLYVIDAGARTVAALNMGSFSADPALSPDGTRIAYAAYSGPVQGTAYDVSTKRITGADSQRVSALEGQEFSPSWSPDGQAVYFFSLAAGGIYRQSVSSSTLTPTPVLTGDSHPCLYGSGDSPVSVSASGRLAFGCVSAVYTANEDGSDVRALLRRETPPGRADGLYAPTWSPDGQWLAFLRAFEDTTAGAPPLKLAVGVIRADGSESRFVASMPMGPIVNSIGRNNLSLAWSPDGSRLAFNVMAGGLTSRIYVVDIDGTGLMQLTTRPDAHDHSLTWVR